MLSDGDDGARFAIRVDDENGAFGARKLPAVLYAVDDGVDERLQRRLYGPFPLDACIRRGLRLGDLRRRGQLPVRTTRMHDLA